MSSDIEAAGTIGASTSARQVGCWWGTIEVADEFAIRLNTAPQIPDSIDGSVRVARKINYVKAKSLKTSKRRSMRHGRDANGSHFFFGNFVPRNFQN